MAAESCGVCPFEVMDQIWFRQIIIFSENTLFPTSKSPKNISQMSLDQQISSPSSVTACSHSQVEESKSQERDYVQQTTSTTALDRPARLNLISRRTRSHPSSPKSTKKQSTNLQPESCKSLGDLHHELEEVKGFLDLGFHFKKENLSNHMISLIPGLQRVNAYNSEFDEDKLKKAKIRPYLSEAWLDYPLIPSSRISRICNDSDEVKKHLKNWARTVAAAIHQESYS